MHNFGRLATWHYRPKVSTAQAWNAVWSRALGINESRVIELGKWERSFNPLKTRITARLPSGEAIEIKSVTAGDPDGRMELDLPEDPWFDPPMPRGEFEIELTAEHEHPECPVAKSTAKVVKRGRSLSVIEQTPWNMTS